jgi:ubiquinone/menaquinone biosynthesis C-methylase UbiE
MTNHTKTAHVRRYYEQSAARYDEYVGYFEKVLVRDERRWVCDQARGAVLEIGIGTGRNLPFYPPDVQLTGVDLTPAMLALAHQCAGELGRQVDLRVGDAQALEFPDELFDTVVATLTLCSISDDHRAVAEVRRVLRPGGRFLLFEHVRSPLLPVRTVQRLLNPLCVRFAADHLLREPLEPLRAEGFVIEQQARSKWGIVERIAARKPEALG